MINLKKYQVFVIGEGNDTEELCQVYANSPSKAVEAALRDLPIFYNTKIFGFVDLCDCEEVQDINCHFEASAVKANLVRYWSIVCTEKLVISP